MKNILGGICFVLSVTSITWAQDLNTYKDEAISKTIVDVLVKSSSSWDGEILPDYPKGKPEVTILRITIPPKVQLPLHKHLVINAGVLLKGELTVVTEDKKTLNLKAGDSIVEIVNKWHYGINEGNEAAEIIVFYAGIRSMPITIEKTIKK
jgi:quercetin dioxygenase-like cupin family protein